MPMPLYENPSIYEGLSDADAKEKKVKLNLDSIEMALPYPKKALIVLILAGGVTNRYGTPNLYNDDRSKGM